MADVKHSLATLSFAGTTARGIDLWTPALCTETAQRNHEGRRRAAELVDYMERNDAPMLLGHVTEAMVRRGEYGPLETGFMAEIARLALAAELPLPETTGVPARQRPQLELVK